MAGKSMAEASAQAAYKALAAVIADARYNETLAVKALGISRSKLHRKPREFKLLE